MDNETYIRASKLHAKRINEMAQFIHDNKIDILDTINCLYEEAKESARLDIIQSGISYDEFLEERNREWHRNMTSGW